MKRVVFISVTLALLLLAEGVTQVALNLESSAGPASAKRTKTAVPGPVKVQDIDFYYKLDADARFLDLKNNWLSTHNAEPTPQQANEFALQAYDQASVESVFKKWLYHGGPAPQVFSAKIHLYNPTPNAVLNLPLDVTVKAKVGELRVKPSLQMTDTDHLNASAQWKTLSTSQVTVPAIASEEDLLVSVCRFELYDFMKKYPNQWPTEVKVEVRSPKISQTFRKTLELVPDHFVVPALY